MGTTWATLAHLVVPVPHFVAISISGTLGKNEGVVYFSPTVRRSCLEYPIAIRKPADFHRRGSCTPHDQHEPGNRFYGQLGFQVLHQEAEYAIVKRDGVELHVWLCQDPALAENSSCRIQVAGIEALYQALMLVRESQCFDLKEIWLASQAIDRNAQGVCSQLAAQTSTPTPEGMGIVLFNRELVRYLAIDCFNELANGMVDVLVNG